jgi:hypothetical protein
MTLHAESDHGDLRRGALGFYREFGALYTLRRAVSSAAFLGGPLLQMPMRPVMWANRWLAAGAALRTLLEGRRVLVLGSGPSANDLESIPDDVLVLTCKLGPEVLARAQLRRRVDLYYYPNIRADGPGREMRRRIARVLPDLRIDLLVCEDLLTLMDVLPLKAGSTRLIMDFRSDQRILRRLIAPSRIREIRGRSFCPWTSTGVRLIQYAVHFGASEVYVIGIDLGQNGYASSRVMRRWHHQDIDGNFLEILSRRCTHVYSSSANSAIARYFPVRGCRGRST